MSHNERASKFAMIEQPMVSISYLTQDEESFDILARLLYQITGIHLPKNEKNISLMAARLGPVLRRKGMEDYRPYIQHLKQAPTWDVDEFVSQ